MKHLETEIKSKKCMQRKTEYRCFGCVFELKKSLLFECGIYLIGYFCSFSSRDMIPVIPSSGIDSNFSRLFTHGNYPHASYANDDIYSA